MATKSYITAGLSVQDTSIPPPSAAAAFLTAGLPAADLPHTGYRLYVARGGLAAVEFTAGAAAVVPAGVSVCGLVGYGFAASTRYTLVLRPVIDGLETPDLSCRIEFETDAQGNWPGRRPSRVEALAAQVLSAGRIAVSWTYRTPEGAAAPDDFCVYSGGGLPIAAGDPADVVEYLRDGEYSCTLSLTGGMSYFFGIAARSAGGVESRLSIAGPVVADNEAPAVGPVIVTPVF